jgi:hypothetical protein
VLVAIGNVHGLVALTAGVFGGWDMFDAKCSGVGFHAMKPDCERPGEIGKLISEGRPSFDSASSGLRPDAGIACAPTVGSTR